MTPTEQAARWLADVSRMTCSFDMSDGSEIPTITLLNEADCLAAIARHLAPGDDLAERAGKEADCLRHTVPLSMPYRCEIADTITALITRISALTATVEEVTRERDQARAELALADAGMTTLAEAAERELATLRDRLARMEEALQCARGLVDTPIARRKLNLPPDDPMLLELRAAYPAALTDGGTDERG